MAQTALILPTIMMPVIPGAQVITTAIGSDGTFTFDAAADKLSYVFQALSTTPPDQVKFRCTAYTSTGTIDVTLETVDATTGFPSGTPVTNSATGSVSVASTGTKTATGIAGTAALTVGTTYAIVLAATGGFAGSFSVLRTSGTSGNIGLPYCLTKDSAGAWTKASGTSAGWAIGMFTAAGASINMPGFLGAYTATLQAYTDATNPDERGNRFVYPFPAVCYGVACVMSLGSGPADVNSFTAAIYSDHTGTPVSGASQAFDGDIQSTGAFRVCWFSAPLTLAAATTYAVAIKATSSGNINVLKHAYAAAAELGCYVGDDFYSTARQNSTGAFTDTATEAYAVYPIIGRFDDGAGGGGLALPVSGRICA